MSGSSPPPPSSTPGPSGDPPAGPLDPATMPSDVTAGPPDAAATAAAVATAPAVGRARPRRWPVVIGAVIAIVAIGVALQQRQVAASWRERAAALEEQRDDARGRGEALQRQLDEVAEALAVSESDVGALEARVRQLADEKAQAEDVATTTSVERDSLVQLSGAIAGAVTSLDGCVDQLFDLLGDAIDAFNRQGAGEVVDVGPLNADRTATTARCNAARQDAATAAANADRLLR